MGESFVPMPPRRRVEQKLRTRGVLVEAAITLLRAGHAPTVSDVARAAEVSIATAYRHFPSAASLWQAVLEATGEPDPVQVFAGLERAGIAERVDAMIVATGRRMLDDEALWRTAARALTAGVSSGHARVGSGSGRRARWVREALAPAERTLERATYAKLSSALMLTFGSSTVLMLRDLCGLDREATLQTMRFTARAVVDAALPHARASSVRRHKPVPTRRSARTPEP
jgi:AcrR family transcriptional regulator